MRLGKLLTLKIVDMWSKQTIQVVSDTPVTIGQKVKHKNKVYIVTCISDEDYIM